MSRWLKVSARHYKSIFEVYRELHRRATYVHRRSRARGSPAAARLAVSSGKVLIRSLTVRDIRPRLPSFELRFEPPPGRQTQGDFAYFEVEFDEAPSQRQFMRLFSLGAGPQPLFVGASGTIQTLNPLLRGWAAYFKWADTKRVLEERDGWMWHKLRCILWRQWKRPYARARNLMQRGLMEERAWALGHQRARPVVERGRESHARGFPEVLVR